jgi:hypothetical protein
MRWSHPIVIDGSDLRFAVPRCWSKGDSNCRSLLGLLLLVDGSKFARFRHGRADESSRRELCAVYVSTLSPVLTMT